MKNEIKLNLGCYNRKIPGFINVDIMPEFNPDIIDDVTELKKFDSNSVDLIYASHLLEHFPRRNTLVILRRWYDILKPGGKLRISVPDFQKIVRYYIFTEDIEQVLGLLYAAQVNQHDFHYIVFDFNFLYKYLALVGFHSIKKYDYRTTEHSYIDDHSQSHLPHMDKINGMEMSLNLESLK